MDQTFLNAFLEVIREQISQQNEIEIEGLGAFCIKHCRQYQKQFENGRVVMMPPKDSITFTPQKARV
jgi:nucleoid DNA-binding protein